MIFIGVTGSDSPYNPHVIQKINSAILDKSCSTADTYALVFLRSNSLVLFVVTTPLDLKHG